MKNKNKILNIVKLAMENDFDLDIYNFNQIEISKVFDVIYKADQNKKTISELNVEIIKCLIKIPVQTEEDKNNKYYKLMLKNGINLEYFPWGYELYIYPDGYVKYTDGSSYSLYYPNSLKISEYLKSNGYPLI